MRRIRGMSGGLKLIRLCIKGNPSSLNILFVDSKDQFYSDEFGKRLLAFRDNLLSAGCSNTFFDFIDLPRLSL